MWARGQDSFFSPMPWELEKTLFWLSSRYYHQMLHIPYSFFINSQFPAWVLLNSWVFSLYKNRGLMFKTSCECALWVLLCSLFTTSFFLIWAPSPPWGTWRSSWNTSWTRGIHFNFSRFYADVQFLKIYLVLIRTAPKPYLISSDCHLQVYSTPSLYQVSWKWKMIFLPKKNFRVLGLITSCVISCQFSLRTQTPRADWCVWVSCSRDAH